MKCVNCVCVRLGAAQEEDWVWSLPILWEHGKCWTCVCVAVV